MAAGGEGGSRVWRENGSMNRLCLGTAAFGGHDRSRYGLNAQRAPTRDECVAMLEAGVRAGLGVDTAAAYGTAEELVGSSVSPDVPLTTKLLPMLSAHSDHLTRLVASEIMASRVRLGRVGRGRLGVLFHTPQYGAHRGMVAALLAAREAALCDYVGTSIYFPSEFDALLPGQDIVQLPYSVFDRRFETTGAFDRARERGLTVYARSPFCQGLVVMEPEKVPDRLAHARPFVRAFQRICARFDVPPAEAALRFALEGPADHIVFGVDTLVHLEEDLSFAASTPPAIWPELKDALVATLSELPEAVIVPSLWAKE
jgi:aryl-alcohol dehydrogenase-like predicted oxidoreductase